MARRPVFEYTKAIIYLFEYTDISHWTLCVPYYTKAQIYYNANVTFFDTPTSWTDATTTKEQQCHEVFTVEKPYTVL